MLAFQTVTSVLQMAGDIHKTAAVATHQLLGTGSGNGLRFVLDHGSRYLWMFYGEGATEATTLVFAFLFQYLHIIQLL